MVSYTNGDCWSYLMSLVKHPVSVGLQLCIKRPENEQTDLTAGEISSSLLEVMGKGAAGKTMCCSLLPGITNSAVLSSHYRVPRPHRSQYLSVRIVSLQVPRDIWILEGKC